MDRFVQKVISLSEVFLRGKDLLSRFRAAFRLQFFRQFVKFRSVVHVVIVEISEEHERLVRGFAFVSVAVCMLMNRPVRMRMRMGMLVLVGMPAAFAVIVMP